MRTEPVRMSRLAIDVYVTLDTRQTTLENTVLVSYLDERPM